MRNCESLSHEFKEEYKDIIDDFYQAFDFLTKKIENYTYHEARGKLKNIEDKFIKGLFELQMNREKYTQYEFDKTCEFVELTREVWDLADKLNIREDSKELGELIENLQQYINEFNDLYNKARSANIAYGKITGINVQCYLIQIEIEKIKFEDIIKTIKKYYKDITAKELLMINLQLEISRMNYIRTSSELRKRTAKRKQNKGNKEQKNNGGQKYEQ